MRDVPLGPPLLATRFPVGEETVLTPSERLSRSTTTEEDSSPRSPARAGRTPPFCRFSNVCLRGKLSIPLPGATWTHKGTVYVTHSLTLFMSLPCRSVQFRIAGAPRRKEELSQHRRGSLSWGDLGIWHAPATLQPNGMPPGLRPFAVAWVRRLL